SDLEPLPIEWLWTGRIPLGEITILDGDPGLGKSTMVLDLAARLSRGRGMPDGASVTSPSGTVVLTCEDDLERVVLPRLKEADADLIQVATVGCRDQDGVRDITISHEGLGHVAEAVRRVGARLVVIDPLVAYLPSDVNTYRDQDVRRALLPL